MTQYLVKVWFFVDSEESAEEVRNRTVQTFKRMLGDALENVEVED